MKRIAVTTVLALAACTPQPAVEHAAPPTTTTSQPVPESGDPTAADWPALAELERRTPMPRAARNKRPSPVRPASVRTSTHTGDGPTGNDVWMALARCESGGRNVNTGNGYFGYFQFSAATWRSVGGTGVASDHDYHTQRAFAERLQARSGWGQWPACSRKLGLR